MPFFLTGYFWEFFFWNSHLPHFYEAAVWGNVVAVIPLAVLGIIAFFWHREVHALHEKEANEAAQREAKRDEAIASLEVHHQHRAKEMEKVFDLLDPDTEGGIHELHKLMQKVDDKLDPTTEGGLKIVVDKLEEVMGKGV